MEAIILLGKQTRIRIPCDSTILENNKIELQNYFQTCVLTCKLFASQRFRTATAVSNVIAVLRE